ncbi:MAG TPA: rRNA maturation RNase YbeY [Patescibacteria group bacterium]|nr:rRNA maturation RNase YbeY [Patescibacteria group bacterium]
MIQAQLNQSILKGGQKLPQRRLQKVLDACARALGVKKGVFVSIGFVTDPQMRKLNRTWRGKDRVTDVLSFVLDEGLLKGEIVLSYRQAVRQAQEMGHSTRDELLFLIVHGVLHLWGYDHEVPQDAKKMFSLQEQILKSLKIDPRL